MEGRSQIYCYLYEGGELEYKVGRQVNYKGGRVKGIHIYHGMSFDEFLDRACEKLKINREGKIFYYIVKYDPNILLDLDDDEDVIDMVLHNNEFTCVYIVHSAREEGVQREIVDGENAKCCIGGDAVSSSASCEVLCNTKQPRGFASRCMEWEVNPTFKVFKEESCTCKVWQMSGLPCDHACAVARKMMQGAYEYVEPCYKLSTQELIYPGSFHSLPMHNMPKLDIDGIVRDDEDDSYPPLEPRKVKCPLGRSQQRHTESKFRQKRSIHCSRCNGIGHNRATCTNPLA